MITMLLFLPVGKHFLCNAAMQRRIIQPKIVRGGWHLEGSHRDLDLELFRRRRSSAGLGRNETSHPMEKAMREDAMPLIGFDDFA
jgi:hypothetical protein